MKNKVSIILVLTVILGLASTLIDFPRYKITHLDGSIGFRLHWVVWMCKTYIVGFMLLSIRLIKDFTKLDRDIVIAYLAFDVYSFLVYLYSGFPERKDLIIIGFCIACFMPIFRHIWKQRWFYGYWGQ